ncbi:hypothetical protein SAMN05216383_1227 [Prevotella sp. KH2C16]|nr:hypothetical protein SAMN05216383_1227 [Prevotella sp. KH2C16]
MKYYIYGFFTVTGYIVSYNDVSQKIPVGSTTGICME